MENRPARDPGADNPRIPPGYDYEYDEDTTCRPGRCVKLLHHIESIPHRVQLGEGGDYVRRGPRFLRPTINQDLKAYMSELFRLGPVTGYTCIETNFRESRCPLYRDKRQQRRAGAAALPLALVPV